MLKRSLPVLLVISMILVIGCVSTQTQTEAYKTLLVSQTTYDTTLTIAADLYKQGKLTDEQKATIIQYGNQYKQFHNAAVGALLRFHESNDSSDEADYLKNISLASAWLVEMLTFIQPYLED